MRSGRQHAEVRGKIKEKYIKMLHIVITYPDRIYLYPSRTSDAQHAINIKEYENLHLKSSEYTYAEYI